MAPAIKTSQTIVLVAAALCLTCACGLGPRSSPYPPPPGVSSLSLSSKELYVGAVPVGSISPEQRILVTNVGDEPVPLRQILRSPKESSFSMGKDCDLQLAPQQQCVIAVTFQPKAAGPSTQNLYLHIPLGQSATIRLKGFGVTHSTGTP
jgi:hypothetical protein